MLGILKSKSTAKPPAEILGIPVRFSVRARRMALRLDAKSGEIVLTWPKGASERAAAKFIEENREWIEKNRSKIKSRQVFYHGSIICVYGSEYEIKHIPGRGISRFEENYLVVHGQAEHLSRRVKDFLKQHAKEVLAGVVAEKLARIERKASVIKVVDPKTRWGSCGPDGVLMFSWRLILMPPAVLDYLAAHEVAHRVHMNHSAHFWELCSQLTEDAGAARRWIKKHGTAIMGYY